MPKCEGRTARVARGHRALPKGTTNEDGFSSSQSIRLYANADFCKNCRSPHRAAPRNSGMSWVVCDTLERLSLDVRTWLRWGTFQKLRVSTLSALWNLHLWPPDGVGSSIYLQMLEEREGLGLLFAGCFGLFGICRNQYHLPLLPFLTSCMERWWMHELRWRIWESLRQGLRSRLWECTAPLRPCTQGLSQSVSFVGRIKANMPRPHQ